MQDLLFVAVNPDGHRRQWPLDEAEYVVGRSDGNAPEGNHALAIDGDPRLSRQHFSIRRRGDRLLVQRCERARNPLVFEGQEQDSFELHPGQTFFAGKSQFGVHLRQGASEFTLVRQSREKARLRRLEDCFAAVLDMLARLRSEAGSGAPWRVAFPVIRGMLPDVGKLAFYEVQGTTHHLLGEQSFSSQSFELDRQLRDRALAKNSTTTFVWEDVSEPAEGTVLARSHWAIASPVRGLENSSYLLCGFGTSYLEGEALEDVAAIVDIVAEMVGHHLVIEQAAEYSSLLGVFGHHVGTLFKTSGVLELWSAGGSSPEIQHVLDRLLPIWGMSQAISLHKKQGEEEWRDLIGRWVDMRWAERSDLETAILAAVRDLVAYVHGSHADAPFLEWTWDGQPVATARFPSLPPLADNPVLFDKTLGLTIGLVEMLNNLRKYPEARGAGREDRRELSEISDEERRVVFRAAFHDGELHLQVEQPIVTLGDGSIPRSRSLERIRALEGRLLRGLVETGQAEIVAPTRQEHILRVRQTWIYRYRRLFP